MTDTTIVVPTVGRASLARLLDSLAAAGPASPDGAVPPVVVVDDRPGDQAPLDLGRWPFARSVRSGGAGPAAARNRGWRRAGTTWVTFVDDDVEAPGDWLDLLDADVTSASEDTVAVQGRIEVPLPQDRRPTDAERSTASLATARWITADMSVRRAALEAVGGFDERFPRAYREDADLALRLRAHGRLAVGRRRMVHPTRPEDDWLSLRQQRGNVDDVLMRRLHGPRWRERAEAPRGALRSHALTTGIAGVAVAAAFARRPRTSALAATAWAALTARFAARRIVPGPRDRDEVRRMVLTSVAIPPAAVLWRLVGLWRHRGVRPVDAATGRHRPALVLFDRDGTLVHDEPYNRDPELVEPVDDAAAALGALRRAGIRTGVVTNQSGVSRGLITTDELLAVEERVVQLLGPFDTWQTCPHGPEDGCACRKPRPGLVARACAELGVHTRDCVVIGDIGGDVEAARAAGARGILVPTPVTRPEEIDAAPHVRPTLTAAVDDVLRGAW